MIYSEIPLDRDSISSADPSVGGQCGLIDLFLYGAPYSIEGLLKDLSESFFNNSCVEICNSTNTLHFFHTPPDNVSGILCILHFNITLFVFFVILLIICLTNYAAAAYMLFLKFFKKRFFFSLHHRCQLTSVNIFLTSVHVQLCPVTGKIYKKNLYVLAC